MHIDIFKGRVYAPDDYTILVDTLDAGVSYAGVVAEKYNSIPVSYTHLTLPTIA